MAISDKFLSEAKIGSSVSVIVGTKEIAGQIVSIDLSTVQIKKGDGNIATISLESISYFEIGASESENTKTINSKTQEAFELLKSRGVDFFELEDKPRVRDYITVSNEAVSSAKQQLQSISNSVKYAIEQIHETNPADYKLQENIKKINSIIMGTSKKASLEAANFLGALYHSLKFNRLSLNSYLDGDDNISAFCIAEQINDSEQMSVFASRHFIQNDEWNHQVIKYLVTEMLETNDYSLLLSMTPNILNEEKLKNVLIVMKLVLLANGITYDQARDNSYTLNAYNYFIDIIKMHDLSSKSILKELSERVNTKSSKQMKIPVKEASKVGGQKNTNLTSVKKVATTSEVQRYFAKAQYAELIEKDLQKAVEYYKEAIRNGERLSSSIPNLISLLNRLENYEEALYLLDHEGRNYMEYSKYLSLKMGVLASAKNPKHKREIKSTYIEAVQQATSRDKKTELIQNEAVLMFKINEFSEAINLFNMSLEWLETSPYYSANPDNRIRKQLRAYTGLCNTYIKMNDISMAKKYAGKILEIQPEDEFGLSIIYGETIEDIVISDTFGVSGISEYIEQKINQINLESELRNVALIQDGVYIGETSKAIKIIDAIKGDQVKNSVNDEVKSKYYFAIAKIIRQILDRDDQRILPKRINERMYQVYAAIGTFFYGNYRILGSETVHNNLDTARYCLFEAFAMFNDSEKLHECWAAATVRYIQTYFATETEMRMTHARIYSRFEVNGCDDYKKTIDEIMTSDLKVPTKDFVIGMIEMLSYNYRIRNHILEVIYNTEVLNHSVQDVLNEILDNGSHYVDTQELLNEKWNMASRRYDVERKDFLRLIDETSRSIFVVGELQNNYDRLQTSRFIHYLNEVDRDSFERLKTIYLLLLRYNEISEFDYKSDTLGRANDIAIILEEKIKENPTYLGYKKILPMLSQLQTRIIKESTQLYGDSEPVITVEIKGECAIDNENGVKVPIAFTNKNNVQSADNVSIRIEGERIKVSNDEQLSRILLPGNGVSLEELVEFKVEPEVLKEQVFAVMITVQYQYKISMAETKIAEMSVPLSIPLYSESSFKQIENKFEPYRNGSEVKEPTMFYGRDKEIESIIQQISDVNGNVLRGRCLALYGQTRTGKSSLLYHLERRLRMIDEERNIIVNIGSIGEENLSGNDISEFLYTILDELNHEILSKHQMLKKICDEVGFEICADRILDNPERAQLFFNDVFKNLNRLIQDNNLNYNIIIMIDEFTYIYDWIRMGTMTDRIMKFWKAFIQNNGVFAIIIGQDHMMKFVEEKQFTNDFGSTDLRKVTYLPEEDAKKLMYEPIYLIDDNGNKINRYKDGALERLYELTAGSAFLIMNLCAGLVDYLNKSHSVYITRAHIDDYLKKNLASFEEARFFEPQYDDKSNVSSNETNEENKRILHRIAQLSNKKEWTSMSSVIANEHDRELLKSLEQRDVIIIANNERCKIKVGLYKEWILEKYGVEGLK